MTMTNRFQKIAQGIPSEMGGFTATVISVDPFRMQLTDDDSVQPSADITIIPQHLTNWNVEIENDARGISASSISSDAHSHTLNSFYESDGTLLQKNALKEGDVVFGFYTQNLGKFYIIDRVG